VIAFEEKMIEHALQEGSRSKPYLICQAIILLSFVPLTLEMQLRF